MLCSLGLVLAERSVEVTLEVDAEAVLTCDCTDTSTMLWRFWAPAVSEATLIYTGEQLRNGYRSRVELRNSTARNESYLVILKAQLNDTGKYVCDFFIDRTTTLLNVTGDQHHAFCTNSF